MRGKNLHLTRKNLGDYFWGVRLPIQHLAMKRKRHDTPEVIDTQNLIGWRIGKQ